MKNIVTLVSLFITISLYSQSPQKNDSIPVYNNYSNYKIPGKAKKYTDSFFERDTQHTLGPQYDILTTQADSLYLANNFKQAALTYAKAFEVTGGKGLVKHRYAAACAWAETGSADSAFEQLNRIATKGNYYNVPQITSEKHFQSLNRDKRWNPLIEIINRNMIAEQERLNKGLPRKNK